MIRTKTKNRARKDRRVAGEQATTTSLQHHHDRVEACVFSVRDAERSFVKGDFRQALHISNQILRDEYGKPSSKTTTADDGCQQLSTRVCFQFDPSHSNRTFRVDLCSKSSPTDSAANIALQSWYEITKQQKSSNHQAGLEYLRPFLDHYQLYPMPLEVMVIFLQFCQTHHHIREATAMTLELLIYRFQKDGGRVDVDDESVNDSSYGEMFENLLTFLFARFDDQDFVRYHLQGLLQRTDTAFPPSLESISIHSSQEPNLQTMIAILSLLQEVPSSPTQDEDKDNKFISRWSTYIENSKTFLQDAIDSISKKGAATSLDSVSSTNVSESEPPSSSAVTTTSSRQQPQGINRSFFLWANTTGRQWYTILTSWTQLLLMDEHPQKWEYRGKLAFSLAIMLLAWRKKRRLARISQGMAAFLLSPVSELVEALTPSSRSSHPARPLKKISP
jgi:hypothetical protein